LIVARSLNFLAFKPLGFLAGNLGLQSTMHISGATGKEMWQCRSASMIALTISDSGIATNGQAGSHRLTDYMYASGA
jgi:hypothetical protein